MDLAYFVVPNWHNTNATIIYFLQYVYCMAVLNLISNMKEMREELESHALRISREESEEEDEGNNKKVKTYIIESNTPDLIQNELFKVTDTKDSNLKLLQTRDANKTLFYVDTTNKRFWQLHSADPSTEVDNAIRKYVLENNSKLDFAWFYSNFLENKCNIGKAKGFNVKYEDLFTTDEENEKNNNIEKFSMLFWGGRASEVIGALRETNLSDGVSLSAILTQYSIEDKFAKEKIHSNGKFTLTKTNSIDRHFRVLSRVTDNYQKQIKKIEEDNRIKIRSDEGKLIVDGNYASIKLKKEIEDIENFTKIVFSGNQPFRLFGLQEKVSDEYYKVFGIDLHTASKFDMEILNDELRLYLDENACGNLVMRLLTNLQSNFNSKLGLVGDDIQ